MDGGASLFSVRPDGSDRRRLTATRPFDTSPTVDPRGRVIAFARSKSGSNASAIFTMPISGRRIKRITPFDNSSTPAFSRGKRIVFAHNAHRHSPSHLWVMGSDGNGKRKLTHGRGEDFFPAPSPSGKWVAFHRNRPQGTVQIYRMRSDGSGVRRLTHAMRGSYEPSVTPDGHAIAFYRVKNKKAAVFLMRANGTHVRRITPWRWNAAFPTFSPNGKRIVLSADAGLVTVKRNGTHLRRLGPRSWGALQSAWAVRR